MDNQVALSLGTNGEIVTFHFKILSRSTLDFKIEVLDQGSEKEVQLGPGEAIFVVSHVGTANSWTP